MALNTLDKNYRIIELTVDQTISKTAYTTVYDLQSQRGYIGSVIFKVSDTDMNLIIEVDGVNVLNEFNLKQLSSTYGLEKKVNYDLPIASIDDKTFRYKPERFQEFNSSITIKLKHASKNNKTLDAGYITFQER